MKNDTRYFLHSRRQAAIKTALAGFALLLTSCSIFRGGGGPHAPSLDKAISGPHEELTADMALERLVEGNKRFVSGQAIHPDQSVERRAVLAGGQAPFAIVLTCSDSRVSPELYFDQGLGNLFVARNAGNVIDNHILGSLEYAVEHLHVHLIVVVGHAKCGAVSAALLGNHEPGHIQSVLNSIASGLGGVKDQPGDQLDAAVRANARRSAELVERSEPILQEAVKAGKLRVVSANYDLASGNVEFFPR